MQMKIVVVTQKEYDDWMAEQKTFNDTMLAADGEEGFTPAQSRTEIVAVNQQ